MHVLDAGCGSGEALQWLAQAVGPEGAAVGFDLAAAHTAVAANHAPEAAWVVQANLLHPPFRPHAFDVVWCVNTVNHVREPMRAVTALKTLARVGGRLVLGQSALVPEM
jgi:SAM-dependent methyltransferase